MSPRIGVVVPVYEQPQFLAGAVLTALGQSPPVDSRVVIVNDGCPFASTHATATALQRAHPDRVEYVRQANAGLSAARNAGVERALDAWPDLDAIFPLDADNLLSPWTLGVLWEHLETAGDAAWAMPAIEWFGELEGVWDTAPPFSVYRQLFENQCDAGTLFRRAVFDTGLRYDERLRAFEDWLFVLEAGLAGLTGVQAGPCGFRYRVRPHSMLATARPASDELLTLIRAKAPEIYAPAALVRREHAEAPRFALVAIDAGEVHSLAAVDLEPRSEALGAWTAAVGAAGGGTVRNGRYVAPVTVLGSAPLFAELRSTGRLAGLLLRSQDALRDHPVVALATAPDGAPAAVCVRTTDLHRLPELPRAPADGQAPAAAPPLDPDGVAGVCAAVAAARPPAAEAPARTLSAFAANLHIDEQRTAFPHVAANEPAALWVVAGSRDDGAAAIGLMQAYRRHAPGASLHLVTIGAAAAEAGPGWPFDTITVLDATAERLLGVLLAGAGAIVYASAPDAALVAGNGAIRIAIATDAGTVARDDPLLDGYLAGTERARLRLENLGAVPDKITVVAGWDDAPALLHAVDAARSRRRP
jgi:hypothetical protein